MFISGGYALMQPWATSLIVLTLLGTAANVRGSDQDETVLHSFNNADGGGPVSGLLFDRASDAFYGTTFIGGTHNSGTVFNLSSAKINLETGSKQCSIVLAVGIIVMA
jgi:hypothetical protein